jgi:hypothetical protein
MENSRFYEGGSHVAGQKLTHWENFLSQMNPFHSLPLSFV